MARKRKILPDIEYETHIVCGEKLVSKIKDAIKNQSLLGVGDRLKIISENDWSITVKTTNLQDLFFLGYFVKS